MSATWDLLMSRDATACAGHWVAKSDRYRIWGRAHRIWNARHRSFAGWGPRGNGPVARRRSVAGDPHLRSAARGGRTTSALPPESGHLQCN